MPAIAVASKSVKIKFNTLPAVELDSESLPETIESHIVTSGMARQLVEAALRRLLEEAVRILRGFYQSPPIQTTYMRSHFLYGGLQYNFSRRPAGNAKYGLSPKISLGLFWHSSNLAILSRLYISIDITTSKHIHVRQIIQTKPEIRPSQSHVE